MSTLLPELFEALHGKGVQIDLITMHLHGLPRVERGEYGTIYRVPACRRHRDSSCSREMAIFLAAAFPLAVRLVRQRRYDLVHSHSIVPSGVLAWGLKRLFDLPYILTAHGSDLPGYDPGRFGNMHRFIRPAWRRVLNEAAALTVPSNNLLEIARSDRVPKEVHVISHGIGMPPLPLPPKERWILMVSRLIERKGFQYAIEAMRGMDLRGYTVHIAGDGPYRSALETQASALGLGVTFHGWLDKGSPALMDLYRRSSIFIFPSERESFGLVLLEAMGAGLAIITTESVVFREIVGDGALYVPPRDPAGIRKALASLIADDSFRHRLGQCNYQRIRSGSADLLSWDEVAARYITLYQQVPAPKDMSV